MRISYGFYWLLITLISIRSFAGPSDTADTRGTSGVGAWAYPLNAPWRFSFGDSAVYASPRFVDTNWRTLDLTPAPGATDGDVGLVGYVPGWKTTIADKGNEFAWYRLRLELSQAQAKDLVISGPAAVDDIYEVYVNGHMLGGIGRFEGDIPDVYSIRPKLFPVPASLLEADSSGQVSVQIAIRVWVSARTMHEAGDAGGIHIAPWIGNEQGIKPRYDFEWKQTFWGYVVDAVEPLLFLILGWMAWRRGPDSQWMALACLVTALLRSQQVLYFWASWESLHAYYFLRQVVLIPLQMATWVIAWQQWLTGKAYGRIIGFTCGVYLWTIALSLIHGVYRYSKPVDSFYSVDFLLPIMFVWLLVNGIRQRKWSLVPDMLVMSLLFTGLCAAQLSEIGLPGIWFPFGVGVSRTQFAYAAFIPLMATLLIRRKAVTLQK